MSTRPRVRVQVRVLWLCNSWVRVPEKQYASTSTEYEYPSPVTDPSREHLYLLSWPQVSYELIITLKIKNCTWRNHCHLWICYCLMVNHKNGCSGHVFHDNHHHHHGTCRRQKKVMSYLTFLHLQKWDKVEWYEWIHLQRQGKTVWYEFNFSCRIIFQRHKH